MAKNETYLNKIYLSILVLENQFTRSFTILVIEQNNSLKNSFVSKFDTKIEK